MATNFEEMVVANEEFGGITFELLHPDNDLLKQIYNIIDRLEDDEGDAQWNEDDGDHWHEGVGDIELFGASCAIIWTGDGAEFCWCQIEDADPKDVAKFEDRLNLLENCM